MMPKTQNIRTYPTHSFQPELLSAFAAVCQHIDWLFTETGEPFRVISYEGSESWMKGSRGTHEKVIVKALPWDGRMGRLGEPFRSDDCGIVVLIRDDFLQKESMRVLWEEYGKAYHPCPSSDLYSVIPRPSKQFQLLLYYLRREGCDLFRLPGVNLETLQERIERRSSNGVVAEYKGESANDEDISDKQLEVRTSLELRNFDRVIAELSKILRMEKEQQINPFPSSASLSSSEIKLEEDPFTEEF